MYVCMYVCMYSHFGALVPGRVHRLVAPGAADPARREQAGGVRQAGISHARSILTRSWRSLWSLSCPSTVRTDIKVPLMRISLQILGGIHVLGSRWRPRSRHYLAQALRFELPAGLQGGPTVPY